MAKEASPATQLRYLKKELAEAQRVIAQQKDQLKALDQRLYVAVINQQTAERRLDNLIEALKNLNLRTPT